MHTLQPKLKYELNLRLTTLVFKILFVGLCIIFDTNFLSSQIPVYVQSNHYAADNYMEGIGIYATASGTVFNMGNFSGSIDFNPDNEGTEVKTSLGYSDIYITKTNEDGTLDWVKNFGGKSNDLVKAMYVSQDYIYLVGVFSDTADFNPSEDVYNLISNGKEDGFIVKLNYQGTLVAAQSLGSVSNDAICSIVADSIDNIFISGYFSNTTDFDLLQISQVRTATGLKDMFVAKYQTSGALEYVTTIGSTGNESFKSLFLKEDGSVYVCGSFNRPISIGTVNGVSNLNTEGSTDILLAHITPEGAISWVKKYGGKKSDDIASILCVKNKIYLSGSFSDSVNFSDEIIPVIKVSAGASDAFLLELDEQGDFQNVITGGSKLTDNATGLVFNGDKNLIQIGSFQDAFLIDAIQNQQTLQSKGLKDPYVLLVDTSLNMISASSAGSERNDLFNELYIDNNQYLFVTGNSGVNFDADLTSTENLITSNNRFNIINLQYNKCIPSSQPTIAGPTYSICPLEQATLTLSNNILNDGTDWVWLMGSCTGPVIGTGDSITISQSNTTTYYAKGMGGCVTNADCGSITIFSTGCFKVSGQANKISCYGGNTILKATTNYGVAPFSFSLDNQNFSNDSMFTVSAGTYTIYCRDSVGRGVSSAPVNVTQPEALTIVGTCYSPVEKYLGVLASGGTKPYQFSRNSTVFYNGIQRNKTAYVFTPVNPGVYTLTVRDSKNCITVLEVSTDSLPICPAASPSANKISSYPDESGALNIYPITLVKPNPASDYFEISTDNNLMKVITVTDAHGNTIFADKTADTKIRLGHNWKPGFYFLTIIENDKIYQHKLIKL